MRVDLNPARAAMCDTLAESDHTTIQRRLREREGLGNKIKPGTSVLDRLLKPVAGLNADALMAMNESSYIELVQWTCEQARSDKRGKLKPLTDGNRAAPSDIWQIAKHPREWGRTGARHRGRVLPGHRLGRSEMTERSIKQGSMPGICGVSQKTRASQSARSQSCLPSLRFHSSQIAIPSGIKNQIRAFPAIRICSALMDAASQLFRSADLVALPRRGTRRHRLPADNPVPQSEVQPSKRSSKMRSSAVSTTDRSVLTSSVPILTTKPAELSGPAMPLGVGSPVVTAEYAGETIGTRV